MGRDRRLLRPAGAGARVSTRRSCTAIAGPRLSPQKTPAVWRRVEAFPLTGSGKIRKFALVDDYLAEEG